MVPGSISCTVFVVPTLNARPSVVSALGTAHIAEICGPGRLCTVALTLIPYHGNGYAPLALIVGWKKGGDVWHHRVLGYPCPATISPALDVDEPGLALPITSHTSVTSWPKLKPA